MPKHILTILFQYLPLHNLAPHFHTITSHCPILHNFAKTTLINTFLALGITFLHHTITRLGFTLPLLYLSKPSLSVPAQGFTSPRFSKPLPYSAKLYRHNTLLHITSLCHYLGKLLSKAFPSLSSIS